MFGKKAARRAQEESNRLAALAARREEEAAKPTPLQSAEDAANLDFIDWESGKKGPVDVLSAPGLAGEVDLYRTATAADEGDQAGLGLLTMGETGSNPGLSSLIKQNRADRRKVVAGAGLADALRQRSARAHGYVLPSSSLTQARTMGLAGLAGGRAQGASQLANEMAMRSGFFNSKLFETLYNNAQRAATMGESGG
jgi:hypothetical protein